MTFRRLPVADEPAHERAVRRVAEAVHRMNEAVLRAVEAGVSVELVRVSRHHDGSGNWGDQMIPMIREASVVAGSPSPEGLAPEAAA